MKYKIIHIMNHPPAYAEFSNKERPKVMWELADGNWVGIWGEEWSDIIGSEFLKVDPTIGYEVWQPDLLADKEYNHTFENGLVHRLFPACYRKESAGFKTTQAIYSSSILSKLEEVCKSNKPEYPIIIELGFGVDKFSRDIQRYDKILPVVVQYTGHPYNLARLNFTYNPLKLFQRVLTVSKKYQKLSQVSYLLIGKFLYPESYLLRKLVQKKVCTILMGLHESYFTKVEKQEARKLLNLNPDEFILFSSSRLNSLKQIDKLILATRDIDHPFTLYISGHGTREYEKELSDLAEQHGLQDKVKFLGYVTEEQLVLYYCASDLFVNTSRREGGPVSVWKAMALGTPVFTTNEGNAANYLSEADAGVVVPFNDYEQWSSQLNRIITGQVRVKIPPIDKVIEEVKWDNCAKNYISIFDEVIREFNSKNKPK